MPPNRLPVKTVLECAVQIEAFPAIHSDRVFTATEAGDYLITPAGGRFWFSA